MSQFSFYVAPILLSFSNLFFYFHCNKFSFFALSLYVHITVSRTPWSIRSVISWSGIGNTKKCARTAFSTNKAACVPTHRPLLHIGVIHETTHRQWLPLTDPQIHEWSVGYQWAARYPHVLGGAFSSRLFLHFLLLFLRTCSRSHAIAHICHDTSNNDDAYIRNYDRITRVILFLAFFFLLQTRVTCQKIAGRVTILKLHMRACVCAFLYHDLEGSLLTWERLSRERAKII